MEYRRTEGTYGVEDVAAMSGMRTRTVRSYLASGLLEGEKVDGAWRFTAERFAAFLGQGIVRQSIQVKASAVIYDFC